VSPTERRERLGHAGALILADAAAPPSVLYAVERTLFDNGGYAAVVRGEGAATAALALVDAGLLVICAPAAAKDAAALEERVGPSRVVRLLSQGTQRVEDEAGRAVLAELRAKNVFAR
jgi:hypothetical protein